MYAYVLILVPDIYKPSQNKGLAGAHSRSKSPLRGVTSGGKATIRGRSISPSRAKSGFNKTKTLGNANGSLAMSHNRGRRSVSPRKRFAGGDAEKEDVVDPGKLPW